MPSDTSQIEPNPAGAPAVPWRVECADCLTSLPGLDDETVDAVITDPPYGIDFQGRRWDGQAIDEAAALESEGRPFSRPEAFQRWLASWASECLRVLRPGGHMLCFGFPRMAHRLGCGIEDAGFEIRDTLMWVFGTGMPKSRRFPDGLGTSLKPGHEPIILARKALSGTIEENLALHGTGALNIEACRTEESGGRYPSNLVFSHLPECGDRCAEGCPVAELDACAGNTRRAGASGSLASQFFYTPKASRSERDAGCEGLPARSLDLFPGSSAKSARAARNHHPTVKPLAVMRWLISLATPAGGIVLDPFCGSGSTGCAAVIEGRGFLGIEREAGYAEIARARIAHWQAQAPEEASVSRSRRQSRQKPAERGRARVRRTARSAQPEPAQVTLTPESIELIAERVAERLGQAPAEPQALLSAAEVAIRFGVERSWVYEHATELGAIPLGDGPRPRLRFDPDVVRGCLSGSAEPAPEDRSPADVARSPAIPADSTPLLPIRGTQS